MTIVIGTYSFGSCCCICSIKRILVLYLKLTDKDNQIIEKIRITPPKNPCVAIWINRFVAFTTRRNYSYFIIGLYVKHRPIILLNPMCCS